MNYEIMYMKPFSLWNIRRRTPIDWARSLRKRSRRRDSQRQTNKSIPLRANRRHPRRHKASARRRARSRGPRAERAGGGLPAVNYLNLNGFRTAGAAAGATSRIVLKVLSALEK
ncbi:hypothetical protein EVAR_48431_1 [Eumeta japonica]|uniref:Uncharacterized protein n=1 Tax=Eumeta variegata TaxID=151549 RepID=A0A4C1XQF6_EUMVA|nr:hypothetical protein EVAR_48431_1 [Eumeta japonica]